ncbi:MAG: SpoIIIAH-like family protein [Clostridia bacterium]|nr:SpoIIIAH-like family protein [Clostridia bacterium]
MNVIIRKRQIIMAALVLALGSAVFVNWYFTRPEMQAAEVEGKEPQSYSVIGDAQYVSSSGEKGNTEIAVDSDALSLQRTQRSKAHDEAFEMLNKVINSSSASASAVDKAAEQLAELTSAIKLESDIDALINAKCGFGCITTIGESEIQVVCEKGSLSSTSILQIKEIVMKHTEFDAENITIFENK